VFEFVVAWAFSLGGLVMAVVCALNCLGLARGWLRTGGERIFILGLGMVSAGVAGFLWALPATDGPVEPWRDYWLLLAAAGLVLMGGSGVRRSGQAARFWRWVRQGARIHTSRSEWRPRHFLLMGMVAAWLFAVGFVPERGWWFLVILIPLLALTEQLKTLPIHFGRRPPNPIGPATEL